MENILGKRIKDTRNSVKPKYSAKRLAEALGVNESAIGHWEVGRYKPKQEHLVEMASLFGVSTDYLLGRTEDPSPVKPGGTARSKVAPSEPATKDDINEIKRMLKAVAEKSPIFQEIVRGKKPAHTPPKETPPQESPLIGVPIAAGRIGIEGIHDLMKEAIGIMEIADQPEKVDCVLQVHHELGRSMMPTIQPGALIYTRFRPIDIPPGEFFQPGDIAVCYLRDQGEDWAIKRIWFYEDNGEHFILLRGDNIKEPELRFQLHDEFDLCECQGKVIRWENDRDQVRILKNSARPLD